MTSRIAANITPVLPSWNPTSSRLSPSCHGVRLRATAPNTTASTSALRMMTALRLYLSAQTPHSGTIGSPSTNTSELSRPMVRPMSALRTPIPCRFRSMNAKIWLTPNASTNGGDTVDG